MEGSFFQGHIGFNTGGGQNFAEAQILIHKSFKRKIDGVLGAPVPDPLYTLNGLICHLLMAREDNS